MGRNSKICVIFILFLIIFTAVFSVKFISCNYVYAIDIYVNSKKISADVDPDIKDGTTFVPLRIISENLGVDVNWDARSKIVSIQDGNLSLSLRDGEKIKIYRDNKLTENSDITPLPYTKDDRLMIPIGFVSDFFDKDIIWDESTKSIYISDENDSSLQIDNNNTPSNNIAGINDTKKEYQKLIIENLKYIPRIYDTFKDYDKYAFFNVLPDYESEKIKKVIPGQYVVFIVCDKRDIEGFYSFFYIEKNTKKIYYSSNGGAIFLLPDYKIVTAGDAISNLKLTDEFSIFGNGIDITEILRSLMMERGKLNRDDNIFIMVNNELDNPIITLYKTEPYSVKELISTFTTDSNNNIFMKDTKEQIFDGKKIDK